MTEGGRRSLVPKLGTCCCLLPLEPAVKIIALAELVVGLFLFTLVELTRRSEDGTHSQNWSSAKQFEILSIGGAHIAGDDLYLQYTAMVDVIFAIYLLVGIYSKKPHYAKIWSATQSAHLLVSVLITVYRDVVTSPGRTTTFWMIMEFVLTTGLDAYCILVVYSYYREQSKKTEERTQEAEVCGLAVMQP